MFRCRNLLALPTMSRAKLIAGEKGLDNGIRWSYKAENMKFAEWVHGQELLIVSTPVINSEDFDLYELVKEAIHLNMSGVLLLVGEEYISTISRKTLMLAEKSNFPIISLPGEILLVDIFEELGHAIVYDDQNSIRYEDLVANIIFEKNIDERAIISQANLLGYEIKHNQRIFVVHLSFLEKINSQGIIEVLIEKLKKYFSDYGSSVLISSFHFNILGVTGEKSKEKLENIFMDFYNDACKSDSVYELKIGIGGEYDEISLLGNSFNEASLCLKFNNEIEWYEKLGFLGVLININDQKLMYDFMDKTVGNIIENDRENNGELMETLGMYFECNENMKEVAEKMFIHPNTVKYRLKKVEELSGLTLSKSIEKMEIFNAYRIWQILF